MIGYTLDEINNNNIRVKDLMHPDESEEIERITKEHLDDKTDFCSMKYRLRTKQGKYTLILDCGKVVARTADGKPIRACGTHQDISEEKDMKEDREFACRKGTHSERSSSPHQEHMNIISSLLSLQADTVHDLSAVNALHDAGSRMMGMSLLCDKLYLSKEHDGPRLQVLMLYPRYSPGMR